MLWSFGPINIEENIASTASLGFEISLPSLRPVTGYIVGEMLVQEMSSQRSFIDLNFL